MQLIEKLRLLEVDHAPDGWPAVQMRDITALLDMVERLRSWLECEANCPCCNMDDACVEGCTFADDCPDDNDRMLAVRQVLRWGE